MPAHASCSANTPARGEQYRLCGFVSFAFPCHFLPLHESGVLLCNVVPAHITSTQARLAYLKATRTRYAAWVEACCGLSPLLETADADALLRSLVRHGRHTQQEGGDGDGDGVMGLTVPLDLLPEIFSYLPVLHAPLFRPEKHVN